MRQAEPQTLSPSWRRKRAKGLKAYNRNPHQKDTTGVKKQASTRVKIVATLADSPVSQQHSPSPSPPAVSPDHSGRGPRQNPKSTESDDHSSSDHHTAVQSGGTDSMASVAQPMLVEMQQPSSVASASAEQTELRVVHRTPKPLSREKAPRRQSKRKVGKTATSTNILPSTLKPPLSVDASMATIRPPTTRRNSSKVYVRPDSPVEPPSSQHQAQPPPDSAVDHSVTGLSTATPTNRDVLFGSVFLSSPLSDDSTGIVDALLVDSEPSTMDFEPGCPGDDYQPAQSPAAVGPAALKSSLLNELPTFNVLTPTQPHAATVVSWATDLEQVLEITPREQTPQVYSRRRTQAAKQTTPKKKRKKRKKKEKQPLQMTAAIQAKAEHAHGCACLICASTPGPQRDPEVVDEMAITSPLVQLLSAVFQEIDEAHAQTSSAASPEMCFLLS